MFLKQMLDDLKSFTFDIDFSVVESYIDAFSESSDLINTEDCQKILEESLEWTTKAFKDLSQGSVSKKIILLKLLFLLKIKMLKIVFTDDINSFNLRTSAINTGYNVLSLCFSHDCVSNTQHIISESLNQIKKMEDVFDEKNSSQRHNLLYKRTLLKLYQIENLLKDNQLQEALSQMKEQKESISETKTLNEYFTGLCYNFCLKCRNENNPEMAMECFLASYDLLKSENPLPKNAKRLVCLLVQQCLGRNEKADWSLAASALDVLQQNGIDTFYIMSKLKLSEISGQRRHCDEALAEALELRDIKVDDVKEIVSYLSKHKLTSRALEFVWKLRHREYPLYEKFEFMKLELEIYLSQDDERASSLVESMLAAARGVTTPCAESLYMKLASHAAQKFRNLQPKLSLMWHKLCVQLCEASCLDETLQQRTSMHICLCYLELEEFQLAEKCFHKLKKRRLQEDPLYTYVALLVAFTTGNEALVSDTLTEQAVFCEKIENILISCCHKAFQYGKRSFAKKCLETMMNLSNDGCETLLEAEVARCLMCLQDPDTNGWSKEISEHHLRYLDKALNNLLKKPVHLKTPELCQWFSWAAWNSALTPGIDPKSRFWFFLRCCCFSELGTVNLTHVKNVLMLAAAAGLEVVRNDAADPVREDILSKVVTLLGKCKRLESGSNVTLLRLLHVYEFEARCHTEQGSDGLESLRQITQLPFVDAETLQRVAAVANACLTNKYKVITEALKLAAAKYSETGRKGSAASKIYHSLIEVSKVKAELKVKGYSDHHMIHLGIEISNCPDGVFKAEEENLQICHNLLKLIENTFEDYPELEILWLMTKCWNWGIQKLTLNDTKRAYKWCTLAMAFLNKLDSLKTLHEKRLSDMFATYFPEKKEGSLVQTV